MHRIATTLWTISPELVLALDEHLGTPVDSYVNGSQTWLVEAGEITLEFRLHPVAAYRLPHGCAHDEIWEAVVTQLSQDRPPDALPLGTEVRALASLWDGLECFAAYGEDIEPAQLATLATAALTRPPAHAGLVDHDTIGDAWERAGGKVSIVTLLLEQLAS